MDHWHHQTLQRADWTWNDLIESATFDLPGELATLWWQERPLQWRYARPIAMAFMKLEHTITGGDPLTGPRPAEQPDLKSGDPLAGRPGADPKTPESEPRP